jgi:hypothetical protein
MQVALSIDTIAESVPNWALMARQLNLQGSNNSPPFGIMLTSPHKTNTDNYVVKMLLCALATDIAEVMSLVYSALCLASGQSTSTITTHGCTLGTISADSASPNQPVTSLKQFYSKFLDVFATQIAAGQSFEESTNSIKTVEQARTLFERVSNNKNESILRREMIQGEIVFSIGIRNGRMIARPAPSKRGWVILELLDNNNIGKTWTTEVKSAELNQCLNLEVTLSNDDTEIDAQFSHKELDQTMIVSRKFFNSNIGPIVAHSRELDTDSNQLQLVIEIPRRQEIRNYFVKRGSPPTQFELVESVPF